MILISVEIDRSENSNQYSSSFNQKKVRTSNKINRISGRRHIKKPSKSLSSLLARSLNVQLFQKKTYSAKSEKQNNLSNQRTNRYCGHQPDPDRTKYASSNHSKNIMNLLILF